MANTAASGRAPRLTLASGRAPRLTLASGQAPRLTLASGQAPLLTLALSLSYNSIGRVTQIGRCLVNEPSGGILYKISVMVLEVFSLK